MNPNDYGSAFGDFSNPSDSFIKGLQGGFAINQVQAAQQQQAAAIAQQQQQQQAIQALVNNPKASSDDYAKAMFLAPGLSKQLEQAWNIKNTAQQQAELSDLSQWGAALQQNRPDIVAKAMNDKATMIENSSPDGTPTPTPESQALRQHAKDVVENPDFANFMIKAKLAAHPMGKALIDNIVALNKDTRDQAESDATVDGKKADNVLKDQQITAQKAGALAKVPGLKPSQVSTFLQSEAAQGRILKDELPGLMSSIPTDPKALPDFLTAFVAGGMKPDDVMRYTKPDANTLENGRVQLAVQDRIDARNKDDVNVTHGIKGLTPEQNEALFGQNGAVTTGKLDPNRINSRTAALFADAFIKNPSVDMAKISGDIALGRNASFRQNAMTAEVLPEIMQNMVDAGKKIGFSDNRTLGKMQGWVKGEFNDPDMTEYMTQRNDALMTVARVMRGAGMTDMAHKAETEVSSPTMSPSALDAWMRGQMKSLQPRLDINRRITRDAPPAPSNTRAAGKVVNFGDLK